jgi:hypothetical protein
LNKDRACSRKVRVTGRRWHLGLTEGRGGGQSQLGQKWLPIGKGRWGITVLRKNSPCRVRKAGK